MRIEPIVEAELTELCEALASQPTRVVRRAVIAAVLSLFARSAVVETPAGRSVGVAAAATEELPYSDTNGSDPDLLFPAPDDEKVHGFVPPGPQLG